MVRAGIKVMPAPRQSKCGDCGQDIHIGDPIMELGATDMNGKDAWLWFHKSCGESLGIDMSRPWTMLR